MTKNQKHSKVSQVHADSGRPRLLRQPAWGAKDPEVVVDDEQCLIFARTLISSGGAAPVLYSCEVPKFTFVLEGRVTAVVGSFTEEVGSDSLIYCPAGMAASVTAVGAEPAIVCEIFSPAPTPGAAIASPVEAGVELTDPSVEVVRSITEQAYFQPFADDSGVDAQWLANRALGNETAIVVTRADRSVEVSAGELVAVPPGVPHSQRNLGTERSSHIAINAPQPTVGVEAWDTEVSFALAEPTFVLTDAATESTS